MLEVEEFKFVATPAQGEVSALMAGPAAADLILVLGHGAGSALRHPLMQSLSDALNAVGVATLRYNYPYSERGRGMDGEAVRLATVRAAVAAASKRAGRLPMFAGGHSMSGRMTSLTQAVAPLPSVRGIVFYAFPLHSGAPDAGRAKHLRELSIPLLFLSGTRDKMADQKLLESVVAALPRSALRWIDTADHSFKVLARRKSKEPVVEELARLTRAWMEEQATT